MSVDLSNMCFEHIEDTFYYSLFGDFKLIVDKKTGYFNATQLCDQAGKDFKLWSISERAKVILKKEKNLPRGFSYLIVGYKNKQINGTYIPKELILGIISWISIEFYDRCNNIILNYFFNELKGMDCETLNLTQDKVETKDDNTHKYKSTMHKDKCTLTLKQDVEETFV